MGVTLFVYIGNLVDWADVYIKFKNMSPVYVGLGFVIVMLQANVLGWRWERIGKLDHINIQVLPHSKAILISFFFSQGLPASLGADAFRVWWYSKYQVGTAQGLKIIAFDRVIGLVSLAMVCVASIAVFTARGNSSTAVNSLVLVVVVALFGFGTLVLPFRFGLTPFLAQQGSKLPKSAASLLAWLIEIREFFRVGTKADLALILFLGMSVHLLTVLLGFVLAWGLGVQVSFFSCLAVIAPALLVSYVPISIAGWGVREALFVLAFSLIGVDAETALLISLGIGILVLLVSLVGGVLWAGSGMRHIYISETRKKDTVA
nr:lysylphosphatidylglycerol synthase transmembrane domain-containing protein [Polynucleobacter sp. UB-Tiil-W10]